MACGKGPGCNGLPMEFYLKFWHMLGNDLALVLKFCFSFGFVVSLSAPGYYHLGFQEAGSS